MTQTYLQVTGFAQHYEIGANPFLLHQHPHGHPFAGLFLNDGGHVQVSGQLYAGSQQRPHGIHHGRQSAFHVTSPATMKNTVLDDRVVRWVPPTRRIPNVHHIHVAIEE